jgi:hypothetical protein
VARDRAASSEQAQRRAAIADRLLDHLGSAHRRACRQSLRCDRIRETIQDQGATANIPPKSNRRWKPFFSKRL